MHAYSTRWGIEREGTSFVRTALEIMATTWGMRLTPDELEWLSRALKERAEQKRRESGSRTPVLAGYRDASELSRPISSSR